MKKVYLLFIILVLILGCKKDKGNGKVTFYTLDSGRWGLIVDGKEYGQIKNTFQMPVCEDPLFQTQSLSEGKHTVDAKSLDGEAWGNPKTINVKAGDCIQVRLP